jgi:hypothetical protein
VHQVVFFVEGYCRSRESSPIRRALPFRTSSSRLGVRRSSSNPEWSPPTAGGRYQFVNLPPGTYSVSVAAEGFKTMTKAGIELTADFHAEVNLGLDVGQQSQAVMVEGAPPIVDTQSVTNTEVLTRSELDALPTGRSPGNDGILIPGAQLAPAGSGVIQRDVGGTGWD